MVSLVPFRKPEGECPSDLYQRVSAEVQFGITGKEILSDDTFPKLARRHCGSAFRMAEEAGYELIVDDPRNTHKAMTRIVKGRGPDGKVIKMLRPEIWFQVRRKFSS